MGLGDYHLSNTTVSMYDKKMCLLRRTKIKYKVSKDILVSERISSLYESNLFDT